MGTGVVRVVSGNCGRLDRPLTWLAARRYAAPTGIYEHRGASVTAHEERIPPTQWSAVREVERLIERHRKLLALDYSPAGWKTAQMVEQRLQAISDRLLQASTPYASLRWLLDNRDALPVFDLTKDPDLRAAALAFDYLEAIEYADDPRHAVCLTSPQAG
jgi:hypothetical protein